MKKILFCLTSCNRLPNDPEPTGFFLPELTHPYFRLTEAGYDVEFLSTQGGHPPLDESSYDTSDPLNKRFFELPGITEQLRQTKTPDQVTAEDYEGVFFVGGHGTMMDFPDNEALAQLTARIYENDGIVAAICHGSAALVNVKLSSGRFLVDGKVMNCFTDEEERLTGRDKYVPFLLESRLAERGALIEKSEPWQAHVEVCERIITGQNPASGFKVGDAIVALLNNRIYERPETQAAS